LRGDVWEDGGQWLPGAPSYHLLPNPEMAELRRLSAVARPILGIFLAIFAASACHRIIAPKSCPGEPLATVDAWRTVGCNRNRADTLSKVAYEAHPDTRQPARRVSRARTIFRPTISTGFNSSVLKSGLLGGIILHNRGNTGTSSTIRSYIYGTFSCLIANRSRKFGGKHSTQAILTLGAAGPGRPASL
jgi:hypothetical protein